MDIQTSVERVKVNEVVLGETTQLTSTLEPADWKAEKGFGKGDARWWQKF